MLRGIKRFFERRSTSTLRDPQAWLKDTLNVGGTDSGISVNPETALRATAVFACVRVLSESLAGLPLHVYQRAGGDRERADRHPLYRLLHSRPNPLQTSYEWRQLTMAHLLLYGNSFHEIVRDDAGDVEAVYPLQPSRMVLKVENGGVLYEYATPGGERVTLPAARVLHLKGLSTDGFLGVSPITAARQSIGLSLAAERFGAQYFGQGTRVGGWLEGPPGVKITSEQGKMIAGSFADAYSGPDHAHKVAVVTGGMTFKPFETSNEDSQFLETRAFQVADIARIFRVPPHLIADLSRSTYSNIAQQSQEFVQYSLLPWVTNLEQAFQSRLFRPEEENTHYAEFDLNGLLRGDHESRMRAYQAGIYAGIYSPNECRSFENLNSREGGDTFLQPTNLAPSPYLPQAPQGGQQ